MAEANKQDLQGIGKSDDGKRTEPTMKTIMDTLVLITSRLDKLDDINARLDDIQKLSEEQKNKTTADIDRITIILAENHRKQMLDDRRLVIAEHRIGQTEQVNRRLMQQINELENRTKQTNIKIDGKYEDSTENLKQFVNELFSFLVPTGLDPNAVIAVYRIGKHQLPQTNPNQRHPKPRTIMVTFRSVSERNTIYYSRTKLRENNNYRQIYLNDDITEMTRRSREDYRSVAALAQKYGNAVKVHGDGIIIDGRKYRHGESDHLPTNLSLAQAKTVQEDESIYFCSEHSFLSNFFPSPIIDQGFIYPTAEHRLQAMKCEVVGDSMRLDLVRSATSPLDAKRIGDQVAESPQWRNSREAALTAVMDLKFDQHPELALMLINTKKLKLCEATNSQFYGIGATLHSRNMRDKSFTGLNKLGLALHQKREGLQKTEREGIVSTEIQQD